MRAGGREAAEPCPEELVHVLFDVEIAVVQCGQLALHRLAELLELAGAHLALGRRSVGTKQGVGLAVDFCQLREDGTFEKKQKQAERGRRRLKLR